MLMKAWESFPYNIMMLNENLSYAHCTMKMLYDYVILEQFQKNNKNGNDVMNKTPGQNGNKEVKVK